MNWLRRLFGGSSQNTPATAKPRLEPVLSVELPPREPVPLAPDQVRRKATTEALLQAEGVRFNPHLPAIESESEIELRDAGAIAARLRCLIVVAAKGGGVDQETVDGFIADHGLHDTLTPEESAFVADPSPSDHDRVQFSWRYEAAWVLFWALGWGDRTLGLPNDTCDVDLIVETVREAPDLESRTPRTASEVLDEADLIYRCHWAVRQADLDDTETPGSFVPGVVMERHHALNWLTGYGSDEWDEVPTDT
ncbi:DUF4272 domain-containing protein [Sphingomonas koreensis]